MIITTTDLDNNVFHVNEPTSDTKYTTVNFEYFKGSVRTVVTYRFIATLISPNIFKWELESLRIGKENRQSNERNYASVRFQDGENRVRTDVYKGKFSEVEFSLNEYAVLAEYDRVRKQLHESNYVSLQLLKPEHMSYRIEGVI